MDSFSFLPLECIGLILQYLVHEGDVFTLASLLRVNKRIASATLPFLYGNPFSKSFHGRTRGLRSIFGFSVRLLVRMLLTHHRHTLFASGLRPRSRPEAELSKIIIGAFELQATDITFGSGSTTTHSYFDYHGHIRHLEVEPTAITEFMDATHSKNLLEFINQDEFMNKCRRIHVPSAVLVNKDVLEKIFLWFLPKVICRKVIWTLASPILEQLESLVISVGIIGRYTEVVSRLKRLRRIRFYMDEVFDYDGEEEEYGPGDVRGSGTEDQNVVMQALFQFVVEHIRLFKGCLRVVQFSPSGQDNDFFEETSVPWETQLAIFRLLPALEKPMWLRSDNWMQFATKPLVTDLEHVEYISNLTPVSLWFDMVRPHRQFLQGCRSLKQLCMVSLGQGSFNWAAQEKRDMETRHGRINKEVPSTLQGPRTADAEHGLVPLEVVKLFEHAEPHTDELNDIAFAFSQTLVSIDFHSASLEIFDPSRSIHLGQGWITLPRLKRLALIGDAGRIVVDRALFTHCPNATHVEINDGTEEYHCQDIVPCLPAALPNLRNLCLRGWSALTFHPATLSSLTNLDTLRLSTVRRGIADPICFIPPIEDLNRSYGIASYVDITEEAYEPVAAGGEQPNPMIEITRPHWSWDWHLPHLQSLHLTSEFAYQFEFRMLMGCPELKHLFLNMLTEEKQHPRVITQADLFTSSSSSSSNTDSNNDHQSTRIVARKLSILRMAGLWIMDDAVLDEFLTFMFPRLHNFTENGWGGITVRGVVRTIRPRVGGFTKLILSLPQPLSEEEMEELGLYPKDGIDSGRMSGFRIFPQVAFSNDDGEYVYYRFKKDMDG
ncbi:hypothetical protein BGZ89_011370 [Linnemannia elongata]|nr:hypothetical protein BGZ89_011370 [Linnemannia elongata]